MAVYYPQCLAALTVIFDGLGGQDSKQLILDDVRPLDATVHLNGYNMADTFELSFNATLLPFSPEVIRAAACEIFMFNAPRLLTPREARDYLTAENRIIQGYMDDHELEYGANGRAVRFTGRDATALLADEPFPAVPGYIETGRDLVTTVQGLIDKAQNGRGVRIIAIASDDLPAPTVSSIGQGITTKSNAREVAAQNRATRKKVAEANRKHPKKASTSTGRTRVTKDRIPVLSGRSYWDAISELCLQYGYIAYVQGINVVIRPPRSMSDEAADQILRFAYGRNIAEMTIKRHHGREAAPQIVASFYDENQKQYIEVKFPQSDKDWIVANAGAQKATKTSAGNSINFRRILLPDGVSDSKTATDICEAAYHTYGRSEAEFSFTTKALRDLQGLQLLGLRPGDPVSLGFDSLDKQDLREQQYDERVKTLKDLGFQQQVAAIVAQNYERLDQLRRPLYTKEVSFTYAHDQGIEASVSAINFVVPKRDDVTT